MIKLEEIMKKVFSSFDYITTITHRSYTVLELMAEFKLTLVTKLQL